MECVQSAVRVRRVRVLGTGSHQKEVLAGDETRTRRCPRPSVVNAAHRLSISTAAPRLRAAEAPKHSVSIAVDAEACVSSRCFTSYSVQGRGASGRPPSLLPVTSGVIPSAAATTHSLHPALDPNFIDPPHAAPPSTPPPPSLSLSDCSGPAAARPSIAHTQHGSGLLARLDRAATTERQSATSFSPVAAALKRELGAKCS